MQKWCLISSFTSTGRYRSGQNAALQVHPIPLKLMCSVFNEVEFFLRLVWIFFKSNHFDEFVTSQNIFKTVIPAQAGISKSMLLQSLKLQIPACAGMAHCRSRRFTMPSISFRYLNRCIAAFEFAALFAPRHAIAVMTPAGSPLRAFLFDKFGVTGGRKALKSLVLECNCRNLLLRVPQIGISAAPHRLNGDGAADGNLPGTNFAELIDSSGIPPMRRSSREGIFCDKGEKLLLNRLLTLTFPNEKDPVQASL
jgi:hypothetical protein